MFLAVDCFRRSPVSNPCRRGAATVWVILVLPLLAILLGVVVEIGNLWLARVELENALESAALAAVKEWGDANGALGTSDARDVGVSFAGFNSINGTPIEIGPNLGTNNTGNPNLNALCDPAKSDMDPMTAAPNGNLIFGAIYDNPDTTITFDASLVPSCGAPCGFTATASGNQDELQQCGGDPLIDGDGWTICFEDCEDDPLVKKITIDLQGANFKPGSHLGTEDFTCSGVTPSTVIFEPAMGNPTKVTFCFDPPFDPSLFPCTSPLEFGLGINGFGVNMGCGGGGPPAANTGDQIGQAGAVITVEFEVMGECESASAAFVDGMTCDNTSTATALAGGGSGLDFGVRAQAEVLVMPIFCQFSGINFGPFCVSATTTARYGCDTMRPRLVRIDEFICEPGNGADP